MQEIELYLSGLSISEISKKLGIPKTTIYLRLKKACVMRSVKEGLALARSKGKCGIKLTSEKEKLISDKNELLKYYSYMSITEIAKKFKMDKRLISRAINRFGIHRKNWLEKARAAQKKKIDSNLPVQLLDETWLRNRYERDRVSTTYIAEELGCSVTAVRTKFREFGIRLRPQRKIYDQQHTSTRGVAVYYRPTKCARNKIRFRSIMECGYAICLDSRNDVLEWDYENASIDYFDGYSGRMRKYICDFRIRLVDDTEDLGHGIQLDFQNYAHIEVKPISQQQPLDKYLYAENVLMNWRFISKEEIELAYREFERNIDLVEFEWRFPKNKKRFLVWTNRDIRPIPKGFRITARRKNLGATVLSIINDEFIEKVKSKNKSRGKNASGAILDLDRVLTMVKQNFSAKQISESLGVNYRTIVKFLEDRSYVVIWAGTSNRHNQIKYATKNLWPPEDTEPRKKKLRKKYGWDNYEWLFERYVNRKMSCRAIGKLVKKSGRLIGKKLKDHEIERRTISEANKLR